MSDARGPLSPHLQIYRWQITSGLSILHRASGLALAAAAPLYVIWLLGVALGETSYRMVQGLFGSLPGQAVLTGCALAGAYHLLNGLRHLIWDAGMGFGRATVARGGVAVALGSVALTLLAWVLFWLTNG